MARRSAVRRPRRASRRRTEHDVRARSWGRRAGVGPGDAAGLFAVVVRRTPDAGILATAALVVVADRIGEPGNLGTIIRSAEAAGADAVVVTPGTVDETNPKVVRASAGALFNVPVLAATLPEVVAAGLRLIGSSSHRGVAHTVADWAGRIAIVAGNEAAGLDARGADRAVGAHRASRPRREPQRGDGDDGAVLRGAPAAHGWRVRGDRRDRRAAGTAPARVDVKIRAPPGHAEWLGLAAAIVPIAVAVVRAAVTDWMPVGDAAYFTVRSRDVLTSHHPLVGAWSSGSAVVGVAVNNLGPLQLDVLAPFTKVSPYLGTAAGAAFLNAASVVIVWFVARRLFRPCGRRRRDGRHDLVRSIARAVVADRRPPAVRPGAARSTRCCGSARRCGRASAPPFPSRSWSPASPCSRTSRTPTKRRSSSPPASRPTSS